MSLIGWSSGLADLTPEVLDILEAIGARPLPVTARPEGPDLKELQAALKLRPAALLYQPLGAHPTGYSVSADWVIKAATLLKDTRIPVIELVQAPLMHERPWPSLGNHMPHALAFQLTDTQAQRHLKKFVDTCRLRQRQMTAALRQVGFDVLEVEGSAIWVPVADEYVATQQMSSKGIVVHPVRYFSPVPLGTDHVLINGTVLAEGHVDVAAKLARASGLFP